VFLIISLGQILRRILLEFIPFKTRWILIAIVRGWQLEPFKDVWIIKTALDGLG
jgi:hypothetical protein